MQTTSLINSAPPCISYQLYITLAAPALLTIGKFGQFEFPAGHYVYTGSAKRNIQARIARHLRHKKKLKWHIDYLLSAPQASISKVVQYAQPECEINRQCHGSIVIAGFGASDCRAGCGSHLKYLGMAG